MDFESYCDNVIDVFNDIANIPGMKTKIFLEFPEYVFESDLENIIKRIKKSNTIPVLDTIYVEEQYLQLINVVSLDEIINQIVSYFSESELADFVEYLIYMFDI